MMVTNKRELGLVDLTLMPVFVDMGKALAKTNIVLIWNKLVESLDASIKEHSTKKCGWAPSKESFATYNWLVYEFTVGSAKH
jgi:hypothetical protein